MKDEKKFFEVNINTYDGRKDFAVYRPSSLNQPRPNSVMFVMEKYVDMASALGKVENCLVFWPKGIQAPEEITKRHAVIYSDAPRKAYNRFFRDNGIKYYPPQEEFEMVQGAMICKGATLGENCTIMPGAYIGGDVTLGNNSYIGCGTKLVGHVEIGNDVVIRENTVIGADGLTTERDEDGSALTMPQFGGVVIGDQVQIGANTVIGRGAIDNTVIGKGCKIDNCCFISHNVILEENVFIVGETLMMGSSRAGKQAYISGNAVIRNKVMIEEGAFVGMGAVVTKDVKKETTVMGNPAKERH
ncbi:MAG: hypothetical protein HFI76_09855 [Lachnospiraceae bacterium]|nr:hypothetical protein [Lachnospiraceae bacterium]